MIKSTQGSRSPPTLGSPNPESELVLHRIRVYDRIQRAEPYNRWIYATSQPIFHSTTTRLRDLTSVLVAGSFRYELKQMVYSWRRAATRSKQRKRPRTRSHCRPFLYSEKKEKRKKKFGSFRAAGATMRGYKVESSPKAAPWLGEWIPSLSEIGSPFSSLRLGFLGFS